jgi:hypothetical protein
MSFLHSTQAADWSNLDTDIICFPFRCQGQKLEIRFPAAPREDQAQHQPPAQRMEKTLRELNDMDPYDFAVSERAPADLLSYFCPLLPFTMVTDSYHTIGQWLPLHCYGCPPHSECIVVVPVL